MNQTAYCLGDYHAGLILGYYLGLVCGIILMCAINMSSRREKDGR